MTESAEEVKKELFKVFFEAAAYLFSFLYIFSLKSVHSGKQSFNKMDIQQIKISFQSQYSLSIIVKRMLNRELA